MRRPVSPMISLGIKGPTPQLVISYFGCLLRRVSCHGTLFEDVVHRRICAFLWFYIRAMYPLSRPSIKSTSLYVQNIHSSQHTVAWHWWDAWRTRRLAGCYHLINLDAEGSEFTFSIANHLFQNEVLCWILDAGLVTNCCVVIWADFSQYKMDNSLKLASRGV